MCCFLTYPLIVNYVIHIKDFKNRCSVAEVPEWQLVNNCLTKAQFLKYKQRIIDPVFWLIPEFWVSADD